MPTLVPIVEGDGDAVAMPVLLRKILVELQAYDWTVGHPKKAGGIRSLTSKLDSFLSYAQRENDCGAILIVQDLDDGCPLHDASKLAQQVQQLQIPVPVAVVLAHHEYEAWFLASLATVAGHHGLPAELVHPGDVESRRGVKEWLSKQMPRGRAYKERVDQVKWTHLIDLPLARQHSRSFRRLCHAVEQVLAAAIVPQAGYVTPLSGR